MTSPDGITWTWRPSPWDNLAAITDVEWNGSLAVMVANVGGSPTTVGSSSDGITWTQRAIPALDSRGFIASGICWSAPLSLWCLSVPGGGVSLTSGATSLIYTSPDGIAWTGRATPWDINAAATLSDVAWSSAINKFVAVGQRSTAANSPTVMTSANGITWTSATTPLDGGFGIYVSSSAALLIATGSLGTAFDKVMTSPDGITWTLRNTGIGSPVEGVTWNGSLWVLAGSQNPPGPLHTMIATSPDGLAWTARTTPWDSISNSGAADAAWSPTLAQWLVGGSDQKNGHCVLTSPDGIMWTQRATAFDGGASAGKSSNVNAAAWATSLGLWIAVGSGFASGFGWTIGPGWTWP